MFYLYLLLNDPKTIKNLRAIIYTIFFLLTYIKLGLMFSPEDVTSGILYMTNEEQDMREITRLSDLCTEARNREDLCKTISRELQSLKTGTLSDLNYFADDPARAARLHDLFNRINSGLNRVLAEEASAQSEQVSLQRQINVIKDRNQ